MNGANELQCFYDILAAIGFSLLFAIIIGVTSKAIPFIKI